MVLNITFTKIGKLRKEVSKLIRIKYFLSYLKLKDIELYQHNDLLNNQFYYLIKILKELENINWNLFSRDNLIKLKNDIAFINFDDSLRLEDLSEFSQNILELKFLLEEIYEARNNSDSIKINQLIRQGVNVNFLNLKIMKILQILKSAFGEISPRNHLLGGFSGYASKKLFFGKKFLVGTALAGFLTGTPNILEASQLPAAAMSTKSGSIQGKFERTYRWNKQISAAEARYGIERGILAGLIMRESEGDPLKLNSRDDGGVGLMMFQPGTARTMGLKVYGSSRATGVDRNHGRELRSLVNKYKFNLGTLARLDERFDIVKCIDAGARYLRVLYNKYGSWDTALSAYNRGTPARFARFTTHVRAVRKYQNYYLRNIRR